MEWFIIFTAFLLVGGKELVMAVARKKGWINGTEKQVKVLAENHIPHLEEGIRDISQKLDKIIEQNIKIITMLENKK